MAKTRSQTRSPSPPRPNTTSIAISRSPNHVQKRSVMFFTACRHVLDSRKKQDKSGESWTKIARIIPGYCPKCKSEKKISSKKPRDKAHKSSPRPGKKISYYKLLLQANAKNLGSGDLATAKKSFMLALVEEWFNADGNITDGDIKYLYTSLEGVTEEVLDESSDEDEEAEKEVEREEDSEEEDDEGESATASEDSAEEGDDDESDSEDDVVVEQFKVFWKEWREEKAKKKSQEEEQGYESDIG